jgi:DcmR-like sensory protein
MKTKGPHYTHHHAVKFYGDETSLFTTVSGFLAQGFVDSQPAIVIATPEHTAAILKHLAGRMIDVDQAQRMGDLVVLEARATLELFMENGLPNGHKFEESVGRLIANLVKDRPSALVRAYGEMVDVLWKDGLTKAAVRLEMLWNKLAQAHGFALLCGYAMGNFYKQTQRFEEVCREHTHILPAEPVLSKPKRALQ